jgi:prephenate dehydrogenase (NADP+)
MGTAWHSAGDFPWETGLYVRGIEVAKINITLRIYSNKWHVYAGLAILNPVARTQIEQYAKSVSDIFKLMIMEKEDELRDRLYKAREFVFPTFKDDDANGHNEDARPLFLEDEVFDQFAIGSPEAPTAKGANGQTASPPPPNSHLSLLAMVDSWHQLRLHPFEHLTLAATPIFRLWFGVAEYLFRSPERLESAIKAAVRDKSHRSDDAEFMVAARGWSQCIRFGDLEAYRRRFQSTADWFSPRFSESNQRGGQMLKELLKP